MKALDLNKAKKQSFPVTMMDDAKTVFSLTVPNLATLEELKSISAEFEGAINNDESSLSACYDVAAKLFSCNRIGIPVTGDELRDKYKMELEDLILFFSAYTEFISELTALKN